MSYKKYSVWKDNYNSLEEYYRSGGGLDSRGKIKYDPKYYSFDKYQILVDPDETLDDLENYSLDRQKKEIIRCSNSFAYFCHKYIKILSLKYGLIPFVLFDYQKRVISDYESYRFNIISKFRQGGLTTVSILWGLWRCMFQLDQQIMLLSKTDRDATDIGQMIDRAVDNLPSWLKQKGEGKWNDHLKEFKDTGSALKFHSPEAARGKAVNFLIIDEAAFIQNMDSHWKAIFPILSTGGSCVVISTVNGLGNWYENTYTEAKNGTNKFNIIDLDFWSHPDFNNDDWVADQRAQLGEKNFAQEILREFLGSGETYFPNKVISQLLEKTKNNLPFKKLFPKYINKAGRAADMEREDSKGACWIWKEPKQGHEYIIGVDCSEGQGEKNDNSCFEVFDINTLEQVAEFYSNLIIPHEFSLILNGIGNYYNNALLVVETNGPGCSVVSNLQHNLYYENLYYEDHRSEKAGLKVGVSNRSLLLESLQSKLLNNMVKINSYRLADEISTFEYNPRTKKAQARKGLHDDAIMSTAIALYVRDLLNRDLPLGLESSKEANNIIKSQVYEEIKKEILSGKYEDELKIPEVDLLSYGSDDKFVYVRPNDSWLKEFGW